MADSLRSCGIWTVHLSVFSRITDLRYQTWYPSNQVILNEAITLLGSICTYLAVLDRKLNNLSRKGPDLTENIVQNIFHLSPGAWYLISKPLLSGRKHTWYNITFILTWALLLPNLLITGLNYLKFFAKSMHPYRVFF